MTDIWKWLQHSEPPTTTTAISIQFDPKPEKHFLSPPPSLDQGAKRAAMDDGSRETPTKKRRVGVVVAHAHDQTTPRPSFSNQQSGSTPRWLTQSESASTATDSKASGRDSPTKQLAAMELNPKGGIHIGELSLGNHDLPSALLELLVEFDSCSNSAGIVPRELEAECTQRAKHDRQFQAFRPYVYAPADDRHSKGPIMGIDSIMELVSEAREAQETKQNEAGWNIMVHGPLLKLAIHGYPANRSQLVGTSPCTSGALIKEYLAGGRNAKMIDFSIFIIPSNDRSCPAAADAIESLRRVLPCNTINHTDIYCYRDRPLAVTIESKKHHSSHTASAELQLATWHSAQWNILEDLVKRSGGSFDGLLFLPAVVINGHDWSLAASSRKGADTTLRLGATFGSTSSPLGVFKAIWGLQRLKQWTVDVFWPWYRKNALGVSGG